VEVKLRRCYPHAISILRIVSLFLAGVASVGPCVAQPAEAVRLLAAQERPALLDSLKELTAFESGSREPAELEKIAAHIYAKLRALGATVELIEPSPADVQRLSDTPERVAKMVRATVSGSGTKRILLLAHMDTVYPRGMLSNQPFRVDGDRAYGLGIADDRQGIAVILHSIALLKSLNFDAFGTITVLINGDEEIGSPGSRTMLARLGEEHDVVLSFEGGGSPTRDRLMLATSGTARAEISIRGRASHAGVAPELGVNALEELAFQVMQLRDLSDRSAGVKVNWTLAQAGVVSNMIPAGAKASATVRVARVSDFDVVERKIRERIQKKLLPEAQVTLMFECRFLPLEVRPASKALAAHAQAVYRELGLTLEVQEESSGGATDAANAAIRSKAPVIEGLGLRGFGAHSIDAEYIMISSIEPRLYLTARLIMDVALGKAPLN
jgi:glutamate carboxypeptidase